MGDTVDLAEAKELHFEKAERPIRPKQAWREGTGLVNDPPGTRRRHAAYTLDEIGAFAVSLRDVDPGAR